MEEGCYYHFSLRLDRFIVFRLDVGFLYCCYFEIIIIEKFKIFFLF